MAFRSSRVCNAPFRQGCCVLGGVVYYLLVATDVKRLHHTLKAYLRYLFRLFLRLCSGLLTLRENPNPSIVSMANDSLSAAKAAKNDEFYTQYYDIEREINAYLEYNPDVFRGKTVLLPCDDPEWSNFTLYFAQHFQSLGLKKLISTSSAPESKKFKTVYQPSLFEQDAPQFDPAKTSVRGKIFVLERDINGDGNINFHDLQWQYLDGDGDFRSSEVTALRDEADIIVTNPPFSLFREFLAWIVAADKRFIIIGNMNAITYKETFPLIKDNKLWLGATSFNKGMYFFVPNGFKYASSYKFERQIDGKAVNRVPGVCWFTNFRPLDNG